MNYAKYFPKLHVIGIPHPERTKAKQGQEFCKQLAKTGKGLYLPVKNYFEIPRMLMKLIAKT